MRPDVSRDYEWGRTFVPALKHIVGDHLIGEAPFEEDAKRATDLIVLRLEAVRVACRVRRSEYCEPYGHEFTIRSQRDSGAETELAKIIGGFGDYLIYGFAGDEPGTLRSWILGDLSIFRAWFAREAYAGNRPGKRIANGDGTHFMAFRLAELPRTFVVTRSRDAVIA